MILVGALLTAISPLMAQSGRVRIRVIDASGAVISRADVSLLGVDGNPQRRLQTDDIGEVVITDLPMGNSRVRISSPGFDTQPLTVTVRDSDELKVDAKLYVGTVGTTVFVAPIPVDSHAGQRPLPDLDSSDRVGTPPPLGAAPSSEVAQPSPPKRRWWRIFR